MAIHTTIVTLADTLAVGRQAPAATIGARAHAVPVARWVRRPDGHLDCVWGRPGITGGAR